MFGHVEDAGHVARHFSTIRALAERTGMVSEFVPLPFVSTEAPMFKDPARRAALGVRGGPRTMCTTAAVEVDLGGVGVGAARSTLAALRAGSGQQRSGEREHEAKKGAKQSSTQQLRGTAPRGARAIG